MKILFTGMLVLMLPCSPDSRAQLVRGLCSPSRRPAFPSHSETAPLLQDGRRPTERGMTCLQLGEESRAGPTFVAPAPPRDLHLLLPPPKPSELTAWSTLRDGSSRGPRLGVPCPSLAPAGPLTPQKEAWEEIPHENTSSRRFQSSHAAAGCHTCVLPSMTARHEPFPRMSLTLILALHWTGFSFSSPSLFITKGFRSL